MKVTLSPLEILDFAVLNFDLKFIPLKNADDVPQSYFEKYDIDLDFNVRSNASIQVFIKTAINQNELPGYKISAEIACIFRFKGNSPISEKEKENIQGYSSIYMALNTLRGFISQFTANAPIGRYIFPSIDLNQLIEEKKKSYSSTDKIEKAKTAKVKKPGKGKK